MQLADPVCDVSTAYNAFAPVYDKFTAAWHYERWLDRLLEAARDQNASGCRILDVACGTGAMIGLLAKRGYHAMGCDISAGMIDVARNRLSKLTTEVVVADMRSLPRFGEFDIITCLHDPLNSLLEDGELSAAFESVAINLRPNGVFVFDVITLKTHTMVAHNSMEHDGLIFMSEPGFTSSSREKALSPIAVKVFQSCDEQPIHTFTITRRHWPIAVIKDELAKAGFGKVAVLTPERGIRLSRSVDEKRKDKTVFVAELTDPRK
jgi:SAM-dependent methyltransferase